MFEFTFMSIELDLNYSKVTKRTSFLEKKPT
jgi:hypothetical protein